MYRRAGGEEVPAMLHRYRIDVERRLVFLAAERRPSVDEWFEMMDAAISDPRYEPGFDFVYDRTRRDPPHDNARIRAWAERYARLVGKLGGRLAVVVSTPAAYGVNRTAAVFAAMGGAKIEVFWSEDDALVWLGRRPGESA
jgi:hypothetical protein